MGTIISWLAGLTAAQAAGVFLLENLALLLGVVLGGAALARRFADRRVSAPPPPLTRAEVALALVNVGLNTLVTLVGWALWRRGILRFVDGGAARAAVDVVVLLLGMDLLMYGLHRVAHLGPLYRWIHGLHHRWRGVRPLTLFVLHPAENLAFGALWLAVLWVYPASWLGMSAYLALNVVAGAVGHLGVDPAPAALRRAPGAGLVAGSAFHAGHHATPERNFGFYTTVWDRLGGTLERG